MTRNAQCSQNFIEHLSLQCWKRDVQTGVCCGWIMYVWCGPDSLLCTTCALALPLFMCCGKLLISCQHLPYWHNTESPAAPRGVFIKVTCSLKNLQTWKKRFSLLRSIKNRSPFFTAQILQYLWHIRVSLMFLVGHVIPVSMKS